MIGALVSVALSGLVIFLLHLYTSRTLTFWKIKGVPFVPGLPFLGNMSDVVFNKISLGEFTTMMYRALEGHKFGGYFQFLTPVLIIRDPELINNFLIKDFDHFHDRNLPISKDFDLMGSSLANLTGQRWRALRYKMTPTFTSGKLKRMFDQIVSCSDDIIEHLATFHKEEAIEAKALMFKFTINVIGSVAFGLKIDSHNVLEGRNKVFLEMSERFLRPSIMQLVKLVLRFSCPRLVETFGLRTNDAEMDKFFTTLVTDTIRYRLQTDTRRDDFLQLMMDMRKRHEAGRKGEELQLEAEDHVLMDQLFNEGKAANDIEMTDQIVTSQAFVFIAGGAESTATVMHFALFELANAPEVQAKVHQEIDAVLANQKFTYQAVREMNYLENVLNETMRLHPPITVVARICAENYQIPGTDIVLEKGSQINVPIPGIHRDPKYFPAPDEFRPERFEGQIPKGVFLPFGSGPRICIAMRLAMLEMKVLLARILMLYRVELSSKTQVPLKMMSGSIIEHVKGGIWLHFKPREVQ